jgi:polysaccharide pyruvyl transferase WcaK-like protein
MCADEFISGKRQMIPTEEMDLGTARKVLLLGAGFDTQNLGVEALAIGTIQIINTHYPDAQVELLEYGKTSQQYSIEINGCKIEINTLNIRFSNNITLKNHIIYLILCGIVVRMVPAFRNRLRRWNPYYRAIDDCSAAFSIAGGDSFSDIYGLERYFYVTLPQLLMVIMKKPLHLLPQTFGPYRTWISRVATKYLLRKAESVHGRDQSSIARIKKLMRPKSRDIGFCHDVAFGLRSEKMADTCCQADLAGGPLIGFNVSGLLYFRKANRFDLKCEYRQLVEMILDYFCGTLGRRVLLMPHVITTEEGSESDVRANAALMQRFGAKYGNRLLSAEGITNAARAKAVIGRCDFFLGSRMHACIGALSQGIPAIGLAYSGKFAGLFATVGVESLALDMTQLAEAELIKRIASIYELRAKWRDVLQCELPQVERTYERMAASWKGGMLSAEVASSWHVSAALPKSGSK